MCKYKHILILSGVLAEGRIVTAVHRPVMIGHRVQGVIVIANVIRHRRWVFKYEVWLQVESNEGKVDGGVSLFQPSAALSEAIQMNYDDGREFDEVELLRRVARRLTFRALPSNYLLPRDELFHAVLMQSGILSYKGNNQEASVSLRLRWVTYIIIHIIRCVRKDFEIL